MLVLFIALTLIKIFPGPDISAARLCRFKGAPTQQFPYGIAHNKFS